MRSSIAACVVVSLLLVLTGCKQQQSAENVQDAQRLDIPQAKMESAPASAPMPAREAAKASDADASDKVSNGAVSQVDRMEQVETDTRATAAQLSSSAAVYTDAQRRFIRTAQANFRVKDVYRSALAIEDVAAAQGGFVVNNDISAQTLNVQRRPKGDGMLIELAEYAVRGTLTVRVPSDNTQAFLRAIANQMEFLDQRNFQANDAQFQLLRQKLAYQRNQQAQQELGQAVQQGGKLIDKSDVIAARSSAKLDRDEALISQKEFEDKVEFSTINLSLYQLSKIRQTELTDVEAVFRQNSPGFFTRLGNALRTGWYGVLDVFVALMNIWPFWLLVGIGVVVVRRYLAARKARQ